MSSEYTARIEEFIDSLGEGEIKARVEVKQPYAIPQERGFWESGPLAGHKIRNHPGGGMTHAMTESVIPFADAYMAEIGSRLITSSGSQVHDGFKQVAESIARHYSEFAPIESGVLRGSTHPQVIENGAVTWEMPPVVPPGGGAL